ncbi:MAG: A24 family peptidase [Actinomycetota bacterium]|nr:A24 family peptidase [Actinomycetota bacterium]
MHKTGAPPAEVSSRLSALAHIRTLPRRQQVVVACTSVVLAAGCFARFGLSAHAFVGAILAVALVLLTAIDLDRRLLPDAIVLPTLVAVLILQIAFYPAHALEWVLAALAAALFFFVPMLVYPAGMGMGDVKLAALLGAALGKAVAAAVFAGLLAAAAVALFVLAREGLGARKKAIAFGPLLAFGGLLALFLGGR